MDVSDVKMCESQPLHPDGDAPFEERVVAVPEEPNLQPLPLCEMSPWNASPWKLPVDVPKSVLDVINVAQKLENTMPPVFGLVSTHIDHEVLRPALCMRLPAHLQRWDLASLYFFVVLTCPLDTLLIRLHVKKRVYE